MADPALSRDVVDRLLTAADDVARETVAAEAGLLTEGGLLAVVEAGRQSIYRDLAAAERLATWCLERGADTGPRVVPSARQLLAGALMLQGRLDEAMQAVARARAEWVALDEDLEVVLCDIVENGILDQRGLHAEAARLLEGVSERLDRAVAAGGTSRARQLRAKALQNLGTTYASLGRYEDAIGAYRRALTDLDVLGADRERSKVEHNVGVELLNLGRVREANAAFSAAALLADEYGDRVSQVYSLIDGGRARLLLGEYEDALGAFEAAREDLPASCEVDRELLEVSVGDAYLALNRNVEAEAAFQGAADSLRRSGIQVHLAAAVRGLGVARARLGQLDAAEAALAEAASLYGAAGNLPMAAEVGTDQAALCVQRGDLERARALAGRAVQSAENAPLQRFFAALQYGPLLEPAEGERVLRAADELASSLGLDVLRWRSLAQLGALARRRGRTDEAEGLLRESVARIEQLRGSLLREQLRTAFLNDKVDAYSNLLAVLLDRDDDGAVREAFEVAERAKSRALVDVLAGLASARLDRTEDTEVAQRLRWLQAELNAVYNELLDEGGEQRGPRRAALQERLASLSGDIEALTLRSPIALPAEPTLHPDGLAALGAYVPPAVCVISFTILDGEVLAFVQRDGSLELVRNVTTAAAVRRLLQRLEAQWQRIRLGGAFMRRHVDRLTGAAQQLLQALYDELLLPLKPLLPPSGRLAIVPHGVLHNVPFQALHSGTGYLLERYEVSVAPSAAFLAERPGARAGGAAALVLGVSDPQIPAVAKEVQGVSAVVPDSRCYLDDQATSEVLTKEAAGGWGTVHLACHGLFRRDAPMFSALRLADGWFTAADALQLRLAGAHVTLSACESGRSNVAAGDELLGLVRGFLGAGATSVALSHWLVEDDATADLMARFYQLQVAGTRRTAALRIAQLELAEQRPHPYYWAPFVISGSLER